MYVLENCFVGTGVGSVLWGVENGYSAWRFFGGS
jgi:hypothetical protein